MSGLATIIACSATGSVHADRAFGVGGLVGATDLTSDGTVTRSHASVSVTAGHGVGVGGLVGQSGFFISLSYATGHVKAGANASVGGLVGVDDVGAAISQSFASGSVLGGDHASIGGLIGSGGGSDNSYATGAVEGPSSGITGGFAGNTENTSFASSYSIGHVKGKEAGGFLGALRGDSVSFNYWDVDTSGKLRRKGCGGTHCPRGIKGLTTSEFQSGLPEGFAPSIWAEKSGINGGLPYLRALPPK